MYTNVPRGRNQYRGKAHKVRKKKLLAAPMLSN